MRKALLICPCCGNVIVEWLPESARAYRRWRVTGAYDDLRAFTFTDLRAFTFTADAENVL